MKKFSFSLEKVLAFNHTVYERERNELAKLRQELNEIEEKLNTLNLTLEEKCDTFNMKMVNGVSVNELRQFQYLKANLEAQIAEQTRLMKIKTLEVDRQLQKVIKADQDVKKMEKLKENQLEEYTKAEAKENQEFILETVSRKTAK